MSFADMKNKRNDFSRLNDALNSLNEKPKQQNGPDERFWQPQVDKAGNGYAVIRFLPAPAEEDVPFVRIWEHGFQGPGGWYIEKSLTTIGKDDPVTEHNSTLWNSGVESNKDFVRQNTKRRLYFVSNIMVVKDPSNPENEGQVRLFRYGKKIFDKVNEAMNPEFEDESPVNPFDFWTGADFKLKIRKVDRYRNYDKSEFDSQSTLGDLDDEQLEAVWKRQHSLQEFLDPKNFKSYEDLKARMHKALGLDGAPAAPTKAADEFGIEEAPQMPQAAPAPRASVAPPAAPAAQEEDEDLAFFKNLVNSD